MGNCVSSHQTFSQGHCRVNEDLEETCDKYDGRKAHMYLQHTEELPTIQPTSHDTATAAHKLLAFQDSVVSAQQHEELDMNEIWRLVQRDIEMEYLTDSQDTPITVSADSLRDQVAKEIHSLRSQLERSQAALHALQSRTLPLNHTALDADYDSKNNNPRGGSSPLVEALTLVDFDRLSHQAPISYQVQGTISADNFLDKDADFYHDTADTPHRLDSVSCPHLTEQRLVTCSTQTDRRKGNSALRPGTKRGRAPHVGGSKYAVVNSSTGSSTSGVDVSSISSRSDSFHAGLPLKKSVHIVETAVDSLSSPDEQENPLVRHRTPSFKRAIERGASGDSSNLSFETVEPVSTSSDLSPDRADLPPSYVEHLALRGREPRSRRSKHHPGSKHSDYRKLLSPPPPFYATSQPETDRVPSHSETISPDPKAHDSHNTSSNADDFQDCSVELVLPDGDCLSGIEQTSTDKPDEGESAHSRRLSTLVEESDQEMTEDFHAGIGHMRASRGLHKVQHSNMPEVPPRFLGQLSPPPQYKQPPAYREAVQTSSRESSPAVMSRIPVDSPSTHPRSLSPHVRQPGRSHSPIGHRNNRIYPENPQIRVSPQSPPLNGSSPQSPPLSGSQKAQLEFRGNSQTHVTEAKTQSSGTSTPGIVDKLQHNESSIDKSMFTAVTPNTDNKPKVAPETQLSSVGRARRKSLQDMKQQSLSKIEVPASSGEEVGCEGDTESRTMREQTSDRGTLSTNTQPRAGGPQYTTPDLSKSQRSTDEGCGIDDDVFSVKSLSASEANTKEGLKMYSGSGENRHGSDPATVDYRRVVGNTTTGTQDSGVAAKYPETSNALCKGRVNSSQPNNQISPGSPATVSPPGGFCTLSNVKEENLAKKRGLISKQPKMPELSEESVRGSSHTLGSVNTGGAQNRSIPTLVPSTPPAQQEDSTDLEVSQLSQKSTQREKVFPSLPDNFLQKLGLAHSSRKSQDFNVEQSPEQEIEEKFASLSLAFKTDRLTLDKRIELHQRARDIAEQNIDREMKEIKDAFKVLGNFCTDAQSRDVYTKIQHHIDVLEHSTSRVSSRAEVLGAVQQECRISLAIDVMLQHVDNLKLTLDKEHSDLEETRKLLQDSRLIGTGMNGDDILQKRTMSLSGGIGAKGARRRASVAVLPKASVMPHPPPRNTSATTDDMDPKPHQKSILSSSTSNVSSVLRHTSLALANSTGTALRRASVAIGLTASPSSPAAVKQPKTSYGYRRTVSQSPFEKKSEKPQPTIVEEQEHHEHDEAAQSRGGSKPSDLSPESQTREKIMKKPCADNVNTDSGASNTKPSATYGNHHQPSSLSTTSTTMDKPSSLSTRSPPSGTTMDKPSSLSTRSPPSGTTMDKPSSLSTRSPPSGTTMDKPSSLSTRSPPSGTTMDKPSSLSTRSPHSGTTMDKPSSLNTCSPPSGTTMDKPSSLSTRSPPSGTTMDKPSSLSTRSPPSGTTMDKPSSLNTCSPPSGTTMDKPSSLSTSGVGASADSPDTADQKPSDPEPETPNTCNIEGSALEHLRLLAQTSSTFEEEEEEDEIEISPDAEEKLIERLMELCPGWGGTIQHLRYIIAGLLLIAGFIILAYSFFPKQQSTQLST